MPKKLSRCTFFKNGTNHAIRKIAIKSNDGILNLAPFSYFNGVCSNPPTIMFAPARRGYDGLTKDTLNNIQNTKEFVINLENYQNPINTHKSIEII